MTLNTAKKGITAVVAIVLLLMMTVAAAGLAYMWISQMQTGTQEKTTAQLNAQQEQMQGALTIESVWSTAVSPALPSTGTMNLIIRNSGTTTIDFDTTRNPGTKLYIDGALIAALPATLTGVTSGVAGVAAGMLPPGTSAQAAIALVAPQGTFPNVGSAKTIRIVTAEGISAEYKCQATSTTKYNC